LTRESTRGKSLLKLSELIALNLPRGKRIAKTNDRDVPERIEDAP
jgi:hypothetical protein